MDSEDERVRNLEAIRNGILARKFQEMLAHRRNLTRQCIEEYDDDVRASNMPEPEQPIQREADSTDLKRISNYINRVRAIFRATPSPTTIEIKPRPISVGTQTWPTTTFKPLMSLASTPEKIDVPALMTADSKPKTIQPKAIESKVNAIKPKQPKAKKSGIQERKSAKVLKKKSKWANKTIGFKIVSKSGRFDRATTKRSVSPVFNAGPSAPFQ